MNRPPAEFTLVRADVMHDFVRAVFEKAGVPTEKADFLADRLTDNDLRGVFSHGTRQTPHYVSHFQKGELTPDPDVQVVDESPTTAIVERMRTLGRRPAAFVSISGTGIYGTRGEEVLTETAAPGAGFLSEMAVAWEGAAEQAAGLGLRTVLLRLGAVLGRGGGILDKLLGPFSLGLGGRLGDGRQFMPWIHLEDAVGLIRYAADHPTLEGPVNAVAPEPITNAEFTLALGEALKRPTLVALPALALRLAFGTEMAAGLLLSSQRVSPIKALEAGFVFSFPLLREALANLMT